MRLASYGLPLLEATGLTATFRDAFLVKLLAVLRIVAAVVGSVGKTNRMLTLAAVMVTVEPAGAPVVKPKARAAACSSELRSVVSKSSGLPAAVMETTTSTFGGGGGGGRGGGGDGEGGGGDGGGGDVVAPDDPAAR